MILKTLVVTDFATNCYVLGCEETGQGAVIDPGGDAPTILAAIRQAGVDVKYIINTHGHLDHIGADAEVKKATGALIVAHELEGPMLPDPRRNLGLFLGRMKPGPTPDLLVADGGALEVGSLKFVVLHTPGHTPGSFSLHEAKQGVVFCGDALFKGSIGRTDLPGGDHAQLIGSISNKLLTLPEATVVYAGHGPHTTIGEEKRHNPWLYGATI